MILFLLLRFSQLRAACCFICGKSILDFQIVSRHVLNFKFYFMAHLLFFKSLCSVQLYFIGHSFDGKQDSWCQYYHNAENSDTYAHSYYGRLMFFFHFFCKMMKLLSTLVLYKLTYFHYYNLTFIKLLTDF